jgi:hypothetical protein
MNIQDTLRDGNGELITNLNASWTSEPLSMAKALHLGVQLGWSDSSVEGNMFLEYTCDPRGQSADSVFWTTKSEVTLDGTFGELLFLDENLSVSNFRLRFVHSSGAADLQTFIARK